LTKLYFHESTSTVGGTLPSTTQSGLTITESVDAATVNRTMDDNKGAGPQTSKAITINIGTARTTYFTRFCSLPLKAGTISANTWNYSFAAQQSATAMQFPTVTGTTNPVRICAYVWRPSTNAKVGDILNANSNSDFGSTAATTLKCTFGTFAGSAVTAQAGDIICVEIIFLYTPTTGSKTGTYFYDGNTENTGDGIVVSNHATYIETPQTLAFSAVQRSAAETASISDSAAIRMTPGAGHNANVLTKKMTLTLDATGTVHDQAFTGVGFQPKAMIVYGVLTTGSAYAEGYSAFYGFSDGASHNACVAVADVDNLTTYDCSNMVRNDACIDLLSTAAGNAELIRGVVKTFDSDGATITWNVKNTTQYIIHALFIGGTDITNVFVGQTTAGTTSTGAKGYTGVGFKPDIELFAAGSNVTVNTLTAGTAFSIGASLSSAKQFANAIKVQDAITAVSAQNAGVYFAAAQCLAATKLTASSTWDLRASFTSHDTDGFTLTHNTAPVASTFPFIFMCIKGGYWDVGAFTQRASSGVQTTTQVVFADPEALLLTISDDITKDAINITNTASVNVTMGIGACDNTAEGYIAFGDGYQASPCKPVMISSTSKLIRNVTPNATATSSTTDSECDISDMISLGDFDINWTTADATARWIGYVLLQKGPAGGANIAKTLTETITIATGSITRLAAKIRPPPTETITISSPVAKLSAKNRPITETVTTASSTLTRVKGAVKALSETITTSPSTLARLAAKIRPITTTITISSTVNKIKSTTKTLTETITSSTASLTLLRNKIRTITTTITISSTPARLSTLARTISETVTILSTVTKSKGAIKALTETVTTSSTVARLVAKIRTLAETIVISSTAVRLAAKIRTLTDTVAISSTVARFLGARAITKSLTETITITTASLNRLAAKTRTLSETIAVLSTPAKLSAKIRSLAVETVTISSTVSRIKGAVKALTETITILSTTTRLAAKIRTITTTIVSTDSVTATKSGVRNITKNLTEIITILSTVTNTRSKIRGLAETISLTPSLATRLAAKNRALTPESVTIGAGIATRVRGLVRTTSSSLTSLTASLTRLAKKIRSVTETITIQDQVVGQGPTIPAKAPPRPSISILAQELKYITTVSKDLQRFLFETVHISDHTKIEVKRYSKIIRTARVKKIVRILDLVKLADDIYSKRRY
jgi:hypothetical protein